jgi:hypothetical protein
MASVPAKAHIALRINPLMTLPSSILLTRLNFTSRTCPIQGFPLKPLWFTG